MAASGGNGRVTAAATSTPRPLLYLATASTDGGGSACPPHSKLWKPLARGARASSCADVTLGWQPSPLGGSGHLFFVAVAFRRGRQSGTHRVPSAKAPPEEYEALMILVAAVRLATDLVRLLLSHAARPPR